MTSFGAASEPLIVDIVEAVAFVRIGRIGRPHGLRGAVHATLESPESTTIEAISRITLEAGDDHRQYVVQSVCRLGRNAVRLMLEGVVTASAAEALRGQAILMAEADLPPAKANEFYIFRAIGCEVVSSTGRRLGTVADIFATGANDVMVVRDGESEVLLPVIADVIKSLDFGARRITIEELPGLLD